MSVFRKLAATGVLIAGLTLPFAAGASAQTQTQCPPNDDYCTDGVPAEVEPDNEEVLPTDEVAPGGETGGAPAQAEVPAAAAQEAPSGGLPLTGGDVVGMTIIGAGAVAIGTVLVRRSKRAGAAAA